METQLHAFLTSALDGGESLTFQLDSWFPCYLHGLRNFTSLLSFTLHIYNPTLSSATCLHPFHLHDLSITSPLVFLLLIALYIYNPTLSSATCLHPFYLHDLPITYPSPCMFIIPHYHLPPIFTHSIYMTFPSLTHRSVGL